MRATAIKAATDNPADAARLENHQGYVEASARHKELVSQLESTERAIEELTRELQRLSEGSGELLNQRVQTVVENPAAASAIKVTTAKDLNNRRRELEEQARVLRKALEIQRQEVSSQATVASREAAKTLAPVYRSLVRRIAASVAELQRATLAVTNFRDELAAKGFRITAMVAVTPFMAVHDFYPRDPNNALAVYLREAASAGYIGPDEQL